MEGNETMNKKFNRTNTGKISGKISGKFNDATPTPPEIPQWLLAAFDVVIELGEIEGKGSGELIGQKGIGQKGTDR